MRHFIITSLLILSSLVVRADERLLLVKVEDPANLYSLFENQDLTIHYYSDAFVIASLEAGKTIEAENIVLDEAAFSDVNSYAIIYCYDNDKETYLKRIAGSSTILYDGEHFLIMKNPSAGFMPAKNDGMVCITQTKASLPQRSFDFPVITEDDPIIMNLIEKVNIDSIMVTVQHLQDYGTRFCNHSTSILAQNWIMGQYEALGGLDVSVHAFNHNPWWGGTVVSSNVIAIQYGTESPDEFIVCGAHFDSFSYNGSYPYVFYFDDAPGADDNATGIAGIFETARILSQHEFKRSIIYCSFTAEECGLNGSGAYAQKCANEGMNILGYFNIDMTGYLKSGTNMHIDLIHPASAAPLATYYTNIANIYFPTLPVTPWANLPGGDSDHTSFNNKGYMGIFPFEDRINHSPFIHSPNDVIGENASVNTPEQCRIFTQINLAAIATLAGIIYEPVLPVPAFTADPTTIVEGDTVQFTDLSLNDPIAWHWFFEGGTPEESTEQHPEVLYETPGSYDAKLVVTNEFGSDSLLRQNYITVAMLPPIADFEANITEIEEGDEISFTNLSQQKPETHQWFFEGGTPQQSSLETPPVIHYNKAGTYSVRLKVTNAGGESTEKKEGYITVKPKVAITEQDISSAIAIYPNPTDGVLHVETQCIASLQSVEIFDMLGCVVETRLIASLHDDTTSSLRLDVSNLPTGIYFIRIQTENGMVVRKIVKI